MICSSAFAQNASKVFEQPQKYKIPVEGVDLFGNAEKIPGIIWRVYSDRNNNQTYTDATGETEFKKINFLDDFFVVGESREYIHIITESNVQETGLLYEDFGWVKKKSMLLWNHCLITKSHFESKQIMVVNTAEHYRLTPESEMTNHYIAPLYNSPQLSGATNKNVDLYSLFYIYKESENAYLIGNNIRYSSTGENIKKVVLGWIPKNRIALWNHKLYLEPNVEKTALKELKGINKVLFHDKISAGLYKKLNIIQAEYIAWNDEGESKRMNGEIFRFPILEEKNGIYKLGFLGEIKYWKNEKNKIEELKKEPSKIATPFKLEILNYLWQLDSTQTKLKWAYDNSYQMYHETYTVKNVKGKNASLYQFATTKNGYQLTETNEILGYFANAVANSKKKRSKLIMAYVSIMKDFVDKTDAEIQEMTFEEINQVLFGLPSSKLPHNTKLKDLVNETLITNDMYKDFTGNFFALQKIFTKMINDDDFEFAFTSNNKKYYWINEDHTP